MERVNTGTPAFWVERRRRSPPIAFRRHRIEPSRTIVHTNTARGTLLYILAKIFKDSHCSSDMKKESDCTLRIFLHATAATSAWTMTYITAKRFSALSNATARICPA